ncbi:MAG: hypothetical protein ACXWQO_09220 [Bdellovibrionota bacterium]
MKSIYLPALESVTLADIESFLVWLSTQPSGRISIVKLQKSARVQSMKLGLMLRLLEQFAFITRDESVVSINPNGFKFSQAADAAKKVMIQNQLWTAWPARAVLDRLDTSGTGRLTKHEIFAVLKAGASMQVTEKMALGIMTWGNACGLYKLDEARQEISRIVVKPPLPHENRPELVRNSA